MNPDSSIERHARAIVIARTVYTAVLVVWAVAIAGMLLIWWLTTPDGYFWPVWPILGLAVAAIVWGLVLVGVFVGGMFVPQRDVTPTRAAPEAGASSEPQDVRSGS